MRKSISKPVRLIPTAGPDSQGITGLETAIVLIAFVVVSSVFAFAALSSGLFSADKSRETIHAGLSEARGTLELRGSAIASAPTTTGDAGIVDELSFQVANSAGGESVNVNVGKTIVKYSDNEQSFVFDTTSEMSVAAVGNADSDNLVEEGEIYEITLTGLTTNLDPDLQTADTFRLELIPPQGAVLFIERTTPVFLQEVNTLE